MNNFFFEKKKRKKHNMYLFYRLSIDLFHDFDL